MEGECDQCGKWLVQEKKDKESISSKSVPKKNEFSNIISTIDNSSIFPKWLVQEKKDKESINSKSVPKKNEFSDITIDNSSIDPIKTEGENPERDKATTKK